MIGFPEAAKQILILTVLAEAGLQNVSDSPSRPMTMMNLQIFECCSAISSVILSVVLSVIFVILPVTAVL